MAAAVLHPPVGPVAERLDHVGGAAGEQQLRIIGRDAAISARPMRRERARVQPSNGTCGSIGGDGGIAFGASLEGVIIGCPARGRGARQFFGEAEQREVLHPHRVQNAIQVIVFVLHHAGMEAGDLACGRRRPSQSTPQIADTRRARHRGAQPGMDRQPSQRRMRSSARQFDLGNDQRRCCPYRRVVGVLGCRAPGYPEHEQPQRHMRLVALPSPAPDASIHRVHHVGNEAANVRGSRICHRLAYLQQHRMPMRAIFKMAIGVCLR